MPYVQSIFELLHSVYTESSRTEALLRSSLGVVGSVVPGLCRLPIAILTIKSDLADAFPHGEFTEFYRVDWLTAMAREVRSNRDFQPRTQDTARWAREQIKRQIGMYTSSQNGSRLSCYSRRRESLGCIIKYILTILYLKVEVPDRWLDSLSTSKNYLPASGSA